LTSLKGNTYIILVASDH